MKLTQAKTASAQKDDNQSAKVLEPEKPQKARLEMAFFCVCVCVCVFFVIFFCFYFLFLRFLFAYCIFFLICIIGIGYTICFAFAILRLFLFASLTINYLRAEIRHCSHSTHVMFRTGKNDDGLYVACANENPANN